MKPTVMILGSEHFENAGMNTFNYRMDDVLAPKRQREIEQLVAQLKPFRPTKIAIELDPSRDAEINATYQAYLKGTYELERYESDQIGFRLAMQMGHSKLYGVDYWPKHNPILEKIADELIDYDAFAEAHNQEHFLGDLPADEKVTQDEDGTIWVEREGYESIVDMYIRLNES